MSLSLSQCILRHLPVCLSVSPARLSICLTFPYVCLFSPTPFDLPKYRSVLQSVHQFKLTYLFVGLSHFPYVRLSRQPVWLSVSPNCMYSMSVSPTRVCLSHLHVCSSLPHNCISVCPTYPYVCLSHLPVCLSVPPTHMSVCFTYPYVCLSHLPVCLPVPPTRVSVCPTYPYVCLSHLPVCLSVPPTRMSVCFTYPHFSLSHLTVCLSVWPTRMSVCPTYPYVCLLTRSSRNASSLALLASSIRILDLQESVKFKNRKLRRDRLQSHVYADWGIASLLKSTFGPFTFQSYFCCRKSIVWHR